MSSNALVLSKLVPGANLQQYVNTVNSFPVLTVERERELTQRLYEHDDLDAARELVLAHLRFVVHVARSYEGYGLPQEDLIQQGNIGLMKAVNRFSPARGVRLITFAVHWIKAEMNDYVLKNWRILKIATNKAHRKLFYKLRSKKEQIGQFNTLSSDEVDLVAKDLGVKPDDVREMEQRLEGQDVPLDTPVEDDRRGGEAETDKYSPIDILSDDESDPALLIEDQNWSETMHDRLQKALESLDERSREVVYSRWIDEDSRTLSELGEEMGVSAERVRQIERNALKQIKEELETDLAFA